MYFIACLYAVLCYDDKRRKYTYYIRQATTVFASLFLKRAHLETYMGLFTANTQIRVLIDMKRLSESN